MNDRAARWARGALCVVLASAALYTLMRAFRMGVDYYDTFSYLYNTSRLAGDPVGPMLDDTRPWLLSIVQLPVVLLARLLGPANPWMLRGPHLLSALMTLGCVAMLVWTLHARFGATLALLGGALFVAGRCYIHYCANMMTDLPMTGMCVLTLALHLRAVRERRLRAFALAGFAYGATIAMKFTAAPFVLVILATEVASLIELRPEGPGGPRARLRLDWPRRLGLVVEGAATMATWAAVQVFVFVRLYGRAQAWPSFQAGFMGALKLRNTHIPGESWKDNIDMLLVGYSPAVLLLAAAGLVAVVARPRRDDVPFAAWLFGVGGSLFFAIGHTEARYLMPLMPPLLYFGARGAEGALALGQRAGRAGVAAVGTLLGGLLAWSLSMGATQLREDADPIFYRDIHGRAARALAARRPGSPAFVIGFWHTVSPATRGPFVTDEYWNTFHASPFVVAYELGQTTEGIPGNGTPYDLRAEIAARMNDGDRALRFNDVIFLTGNFMTGPRDEAIEVWRAHRLERAPAEIGLRAPREDGHPSATALPAGGPWWIFARKGQGPWTYAGTSTEPPQPSSVLATDAAGADRFALLRVDVERFD